MHPTGRISGCRFWGRAKCMYQPSEQTDLEGLLPCTQGNFQTLQDSSPIAWKGSLRQARCSLKRLAGEGLREEALELGSAANAGLRAQEPTLRTPCSK